MKVSRRMNSIIAEASFLLSPLEVNREESGETVSKSTLFLGICARVITKFLLKRRGSSFDISRFAGEEIITAVVLPSSTVWTSSGYYNF